jgi:uncharacterized protein with HEPN domain
VIEGHRAHRHASDASSRQLARDAVAFNLIAIGEICVRLGEPFHDTHPGIPWAEVIAQRNIIAHGYDIIDMSVLAATIEKDIPALIAEAEKLLRAYGS